MKITRRQMDRRSDERMEKFLILVFYMATWVVSVSDGFNIDVSDPERFSGNKEDFFGYRVLQYQSDTNKQIVVSAPLKRRTDYSSGAIYNCTPNTGSCSLLEFETPDSGDALFFGMSMAVRSTPSKRLTSCSPSFAHDCDGNSYLSGICFHFSSELDFIAKNVVALQESQKMVNLVFLFDGSASMKTVDFNKNKQFIWKIMTQFRNSSIQFAAVQFSSSPRTVFTFNDYMIGTAEKKLEEENHMKTLTNTHQAIDFVLVHHFDNMLSGADPEATKALVIITDGVPSDFNSKDVIKRCDDQHIIRFIIGVGNVDLDKLRFFSSHPKDSNTFQITDYSGLQGLQDKLQNKIYKIKECQNMVNLVFLFDGSASMRTSDFNKNKQFIWKIMTQFRNSSIQFAAVQFSSSPRTVFTFNDYMIGTAEKKLDGENHMKALTNTHQAIDFVLVNHFDNVLSGADPEATKALVIITDGVPSDFNTKDVIKRCDDQHIIRFIIGVGNVDLDKLRFFSSHPKDSNTFQITDYSGLQGLQDKLQNKIYKIKGDQSGGHRDRNKEWSERGFSAVYVKDALVLGAVGSNEWRGMLYEVKETVTGFSEMEIKDPSLNNNSYMGYSMAVGQKAGISLLFSGAPRSNYNGQVTLFSKRSNTWDVVTSVMGEQVGSYFGGALCVLDLDSDGNTDFVVVGAPLYYQALPQREGRMYVYSLSEQMALEKQLEVADCVQGQFAASVAPLADLNGDNLQDVAVGAPLEDDGRGAIYIYLGNLTQGIRLQYSQRILARTISDQLQQFGVAIDGVMDMEGDGLTDIVVGARGAMMLLKARPVLSVSAQLSFSPSEISLDHFDCLLKSDKTIPVVTLSTCFSVEENTHSTGAVNSGLNVSYEINADAVRQWSRALFYPTVKNSRTLQTSVLLNSHYSCFNHTVYMPDCVKDTLSPVLLRLNFSQAEHQPSSSNAPILNIDSRTMAYVEVPFQRNCGNVSCVADLEMDFNFLDSRLLVVDQSYFNITVSLLNKGDDSFNTSIELRYPLGLSLSKFDTTKASRRTLSSCGDRDDGALDKTTCSISLPVYRKDTSASFQGTFRVDGSYDWNDTMEMTLVASSDNNGNFTDGMVRKTLPVQFAVDVAVSAIPEESVTYLDFSLEEKGPKPVSVVYMVRNLGVKGLPVLVSFMMPSQIGNNFMLDKHNIIVPQHLKGCSSGKGSDSANWTGCTIRGEDDPALCLNQTSCVKFECPSFCLEKESAVRFELKAQVTFLNPEKYTGRWPVGEFSLEEVLWSFAELDFDRIRYSQTPNGPKDDATKFQSKVRLLLASEV